VGGLVRASGAGLGCPDWPRCFGSWIPPLSAADLPARFDPALFKPTLMWTEYLNRLLGMTVGLMILATTISAWRHHRREPPDPVGRPPERRLLAVDMPEVCPIRGPGVLDGLTPLRLVP
jgi:heme A synthase